MKQLERLRVWRKDRILVQVFLKKDTAMKLAERAAAEDLPMSHWLRRLCIEALNRPAGAPPSEVAQ